MHLFILIHGLEASFTEMIPLMNEITRVNSNAGFLLPKSVRREKSRSRIEDLGFEIAKEIEDWIENEYDEGEIGKITFIWHSLGGIIGRAAISYLEKYSHLFYAYISFASPHLGITNWHQHVKIGLWLTELLKTYDWVTQLKMRDAVLFEDTFMYTLSKKRCFEYFEHIYFFSSQQDNIVPYSSSRFQIFKDELESPLTSNLLTLAQNCFSNVKTKINRVDVGKY